MTGRPLDPRFDGHVRDLLIIFRSLALVLALFLVFFSPVHTGHRPTELVVSAIATVYTVVYILFFRHLCHPQKTLTHLIVGGLDLLIGGVLLFFGCVQLPEYFLYVLSPIFTAAYFFDRKVGFLAATIMAVFYHLALSVHLGSWWLIFKSPYVGVYLANIVGYYVAVVVFSYWVNLLRYLQNEMETVEKMNTRLRELHGQLEEMAVLQERARLSREVHDRVASKLYGVGLRLEMLASRLWPPEREALLAVKEQVVQSQVELKECLRSLQREEGPVRDFREIVREVVECFQNQLDLRIVLKSPGEPLFLEAKQARELTYVLSEALTNVRKHAQASRVVVTLTRQKDWVVLSIEDDGRGFDMGNTQPGGFGLMAMRSRTEELAGHYYIESFPGRGTRIRVEVPALEVKTAS